MFSVVRQFQLVVLVLKMIPQVRQMVYPPNMIIANMWPEGFLRQLSIYPNLCQLLATFAMADLQSAYRPVPEK